MSNMVINTNVLALNSHRSLKGLGGDISKSSERLSSGLRINRAADDAAGLAISEKMRSQVRGLNQASTNAQDGISLIQTAEGALQETQNMLQRMRQLVVQASNDTLTDKDRAKIALELNQLTEEIDATADKTEFNTKKLINGDWAKNTIWLQTGANKAQGLEFNISEMTAKALGVEKKDIGDKVGSTADATELAFDVDGTAILGGASGIDTSGTTPAADYVGKYNLGGGVVLEIEDDAGDLVFKVGDTSVKLSDLANGDELLEDHFGLTAAQVGEIGTLTYDDSADTITWSPGTGTATVTITDAKDNGGTIEFSTGNEITLIKDPASTGSDGVVANVTYKFTLAEGTKVFNSAGEEVEIDQTVAYTVAELDALFTDGTVVVFDGTDAHFATINTTAATATSGYAAYTGESLAGGAGSGGKAISSLVDTLDAALEIVSTQRAELGAYQNRLEHTIKNLDVSAENLAASESRIRDTDMAKEMMILTKNNVLSQASISMLAQANTAPQNLLQLLR